MSWDGPSGRTPRVQTKPAILLVQWDDDPGTYLGTLARAYISGGTLSTLSVRTRPSRP